MPRSIKAKLVLQDGAVFEGISFGAEKECCGEVVFNTSMTGYQEILTDPSYKGQIVSMTYPLIGNYGVNSEDIESKKIFLEGFVVKEKSIVSSNWRSEQTLDEYLKKNSICGIEGIDTRKLTRYIRLKGAMKACISALDLDNKRLTEKARQSRGLVGVDLVKTVSSKKPYHWNKQTDDKAPVVVVLDCGVKFNILRNLEHNGCSVVVLPAKTSAQQVLSFKPQGILVSNGPGDPQAVKYVVSTIRQLLGKVPLFGICLGHQLFALALGAGTYKLKFGHHGANHPVKDLLNDTIAITSQNHGFCVDMQDIEKSGAEVTHVNLYDGTCEGMRHKDLQAFSVQYHPEAGPGPKDAEYLFKQFICLIKDKSKKNA